MASNQMQILQALIEANDPEAIPILIDCLGSSHQSTVRFAAESIGTMAKKQKDICNMAVSELVDVLASENAQIRKSVLNTLLLLDIPLCYSSAINNVVRGDSQLYNKAIAKKIVQNIISSNSSSKYDNYSEPSSTFKQGAEAHNVDQDTASKTVVPHMQIDRGVIKSISAVMSDVDAEYYDFRDFLKSGYSSTNLQQESSEVPDFSNEVSAFVDNKESVEEVMEDPAGDYDEKNEPLISSLSFEELLALDRPAEYISEELWRAWCDSIKKSPMASTKVIKIAKKHSLFWENQFIRFSRYLNYSLHDIKNFYGFNNKKVRTLILCVASLNLPPSTSEDTPFPDIQLIDEKKLSSQDSEQSGLITKPLDDHTEDNQDFVDKSDGTTGVFDYELSDKLVIDDHYNEIMQSYDPEKLIPSAIYDRWRVSLEGTIYANQNLSELAFEINLRWPTTRYDEKLSDYLEYDISSIRSIPTFGQ